MKLSVSIMAHPSRAQYVEGLKNILGDVPVAVDTGDGIWRNRVAASQMYEPTAEYHLVLQDDAILCNDFMKKAVDVIDKRRGDAISFYFGKRGVRIVGDREEEIKKNGGLVWNWLGWGVAICLPVKIIPGLIRFCDAMTRYARHDDTRMSHYLRKISMNIFYPVPSLVDHRTDAKSIMENSEGGHARTAWRFEG